MQSAASAIALAYTDKLELFVQVPMTLAVGVVATAAFSYVDVRARKKEALLSKDKGFEMEEVEREKRPKPTEVQEGATSKL